MDFETAQCYSVQPADFACIAEGCFLVSYVFCFQTTHLLFLAFSPLQHFVLLPLQAPSCSTSLYPPPYSFSLTLSQGFNFHCCFLAQLTKTWVPFSFCPHPPHPVPIILSKMTSLNCLLFPPPIQATHTYHLWLDIVDAAWLSAHGTASPGTVQLQLLTTFRQHLSSSLDSHHCFLLEIHTFLQTNFMSFLL